MNDLLMGVTLPRPPKYVQGDVVGGWSLVELLGMGGNAEVWRAAKDADEVALKVLRNRHADSEPYRRFRQEVDALRVLAEVSGVLPLIDHELPERPTKTEPAWVSMPIATPLRDALRDATLENIVEAIATIADTLARIRQEHRLGHRDIKPGNLYCLGGEWLVGDFGLVAAPTSDDLTEVGKSLGPRNFMPYEMLEDAKNADPFPADVYSLAKTMYVLITEARWPPPGEQRLENRAFDLSNYKSHRRAHDLNRLIDLCTRHSPDERPEMKQVADDLTSWMGVDDDETEVPDFSESARRLRELAAPKLDEVARRNRLHRRGGELAHAFALLRRPLNDSIRQAYPAAEIEVHGNVAEQYFGTRFARTGNEVKIYYDACGTRIVGPGLRPWVLEIGSYLAVWEDGLATIDVIITVYREGMLGGADWKRSWKAPAESIQADAILPEAAREVAQEFPTWLDRFVERLAGEAGM